MRKLWAQEMKSEKIEEKNEKNFYTVQMACQSEGHLKSVGNEWKSYFWRTWDNKQERTDLGDGKGFPLLPRDLGVSTPKYFFL